MNKGGGKQFSSPAWSFLRRSKSATRARLYAPRQDYKYEKWYTADFS